MSRKPNYSPEDDWRVERALACLRRALMLLKAARCKRTAERVRLAISSAKGAARNVHYRRIRAEQKHRAGIMRVGELYQPTLALVEAQRREQA